MEWIEIASKLGIPATLALALIFVFGRGMLWMGRQILLPLKNRHFEFLSVIEGTQRTQAEALRQLVHAERQHAQALGEMRRTLDVIEQRTTECDTRRTVSTSTAPA